MQLSFPAKLNLATALGQLTKDLKAAGSILNEIRNKLAHGSTSNLPAKNMTDFGTLCPILYEPLS